MSQVEHLKSHEASAKASDLLHRPDLMNQLLGETVTPIIIPPDCPTHLDWRNNYVHDVLSEIRDQGKYGCAWSIVAVEAVEAQYRRYRGPLHLLSHQNLLDRCTIEDPEFAYYWWSRGNNLVYSAQDYPLISKRSAKHLATVKPLQQPGIQIYGYMTIPALNRQLVMRHLNKYPLITYMELYPSLLNLDANTVYEGPTSYDLVECINYNHPVLLVGYGTDYVTRKNYWLVKNSLGKRWGDNGYGKVSRDIKFKGEFLLKEDMTFPKVTQDEDLYLS